MKHFALAALLFTASPLAPITPPAPAKVLEVSGVIDSELAIAVEGALQKPGYAVIRINSEGGDVGSSLRIARAIEAHQGPLVCIVDGDALSGAFALLQSCPVRLATERSRLMFHGATIVMPVNAATIAAVPKLLKVVNSALVSQCAQKLRSGTSKLWEVINAGEDWWMTPSEALSEGAVDAVITTATDDSHPAAH